MRLKSLYIKGFKSFANETVLHFNEDVIGVVGPNGSGKSNIVDAIRWVLGEQKSKELRLQSMTDVIFNGTKKRKAAPTAVVELTFDNDKNILSSEYNTIAVSRTLYRSGESEYRLNNVLCRLKDITSLFMDTGIGSNSYAIIALGMVDDILADKDHARRKMFEQAAGVSKYKKRKYETLNKLKNTSEDLDRINDLLFEIEANMKSLEKQARRTKKYFEIKERYKELSIDLASRSIHTLKEEYKSLNKKLSSDQEIYNSLQAKTNKKQALVEEEKKKNLDKEIHLSQKQTELNELVGNVRTTENEKDLLIQRIEFKSTNITATENALKNNKRNLEELQKEVKSIEDRINNEKRKSVILQEDLEVLHKKYEEIKSSQGVAKQLSDTKTQKLKQIQDKSYEIDKKIAVNTNSMETLGSEINILNQQIQNSESEYKAQEQAEQEIMQQISLKEKELNTIKEEATLRKEKIQGLDANREEIQITLNQVNRRLDSKQNEYDLLKSMVESYEGFPESIKYLSNHWRNDIPVLSDLLDVEEAFKSIIEQYLEPYLNYYVVQGLPQANEAIRMLRGAQKGKANFFLLEEIPKEKTNVEQIQRARPAIEVVHVDPDYQDLLNYLLRDAYIFNGEIEDFTIEKKLSDKIFLSSLGTFIKTKNTISGGSMGLFEGKKIGRKKNLEKIQKLRNKLEKEKEKIQAQLHKVIEDLKIVRMTNESGNIDKIQSEFNQLIQQKARITSQVESLRNINQDRRNKVLESRKKIEELDKLINTLRNEKVLLEGEVKKVHEEFDSGGVDLDVLNEELRFASDAYNSANIEVIKQHNLIDNFVKEAEYKHSRIADVTEKIDQDTHKLKRDQADHKESKEKLIQLEARLIELYQEKETYQGNLSSAEQAYYNARNAITDIEEEVRKFNRNLNQKQLEINNLKDQFNDIRFKISSVGERLKIEFDININDIINEDISSDMPLAELQEKVGKIRNRISNYGEINPMALEAYEEIKIRYDNIVKQRQDILGAKDSLLKTISEIETTAKEKFMESFDQVRENFILVFRSLFTEDDNCDLILLDEENPLESDIEIVAKPKGKKPRSLSQLSGGEKTLTATALLFALYLLKPAPFCIFDEVDAPLDDANIQKFNKIINKFSKDSQFIIVTHNKATMAAVDVLYGVYMQEVGVSGIAPVDFRSLKEQPMFEQVN
jgi:chromosome segregation protein